MARKYRVRGKADWKKRYVSENKLLMMAVCFGAVQLLLIVLNIALLFTTYSPFAAVFATAYIMFAGYYVHCVGELADIGYPKIRWFRFFQWFAPIFYTITFFLAILA